jgi:phage-related tail protein
MPEEFYTNKELFERFSAMFDELQKDLNETTMAVKKYNGLHEKFAECSNLLNKQVNRCNEVQAGKVAQTGIFDRLLQLWPIILSTIIFALSRL